MAPARHWHCSPPALGAITDPSIRSSSCGAAGSVLERIVGQRPETAAMVAWTHLPERDLAARDLAERRFAERDLRACVGETGVLATGVLATGA